MPNYFYTTLSPSQQILFGFLFCLAVIFRDISFSLSAGQRPIRTQQRFLVSSHWLAPKLVCSSISCLFVLLRAVVKGQCFLFRAPFPYFFYTTPLPAERWNNPAEQRPPLISSSLVFRTSRARQSVIERATRGQGRNPEWSQERRQRLTASNFGRWVDCYFNIM